jgi:hypothetical protein
MPWLVTTTRTIISIIGLLETLKIGLQGVAEGV